MFAYAMFLDIVCLFRMDGNLENGNKCLFLLLLSYNFLSVGECR